MPIATTTAAAIRSSLYTYIQALTPASFASEYPWTKTEQLDGGETPRSFRIVNDIPSEDPDGIHGADGIGCIYEMAIEVSYGGPLTREEAEDLIAEDQKALSLMLHPLPTSTASGIPGLLPFTDPLTAELIDDEDGNLLVAFVTAVRFKQADS